MSKWIQFLEPGPTLDTDLQLDPMAVLEKPTNDLELVRRCLEHFIVLTGREYVTKQEERDRYRQVKPGSRTLLWLIGGDGYHKFDLGINPEFLRVVVHCLAAEHGEEFLWTWLSINEVPAFATSWRVSEQIAWRGSVLRYLLESTTYWAPDIRQGLETALGLYEHAISLCRTREGQSPPYIPLYPAGIWLHKQLCNFKSHGVSPQSLGRFAGSLTLWATNPDELQFNRAMVILPFSPYEAYEFFQLCELTTNPTVYMRDLFNPQDTKSANHVFHCTVRTAQTLHQKNHPKQARHLLDIGHRRMPQVFNQRPVRDSNKQSPSSWRFRKRATPSQIKAGVSVDQDGVPPCDGKTATDKRRYGKNECGREKSDQ